MVILTTSIEIAAPPERVREVFLDFKSIGSWQSFFKSIEIVEQRDATRLQAGDKVQVAFSPTMKMVAPITSNTTSLFQWAGGWRGIFLGVHSFAFEPSKITPGSTTFTNSEEFSGVLSFLMNFSFGESTKKNWNEFNTRLKEQAEQRVVS